MHAVVEIAGKQFRVSDKEKIRVPLLSSKEGDKVSFDKIHMIEDDKGKVTFGSPLVSNMAVDATVVEHGRDKKLVVFKKKRRKGYQKKNGHRQGYSIIEINTIGASKATPKKTAAKTAEKAEVKAPKKETAKKTEPATTKKTATKKTATKKTTTATKTKAKSTTKPKSTAAKKSSTKDKAKEE
jgi:large subunit ribosomal protein L21